MQLQGCITAWEMCNKYERNADEHSKDIFPGSIIYEKYVRSDVRL